MKKLFIAVSVLAIAATTVFIACKKGNELTTTKKSNASARTVEATVSVNRDYGFLVFSKADDLDNFKKQIVGNTHGDVRAYLNSLEFNSLGKTAYESVSDEAEVTEEQAISYLLNTSGVVQIKNVVMKQINQTESQDHWDFFLTMNTDKLDADSYSSLSDGTFNSIIMNKFACGQELEGGLLPFIDEHPYGFEATATADKARKPFWGWGDEFCVTGEDVLNAQTALWEHTKKTCRKHYLIFWTSDYTDCTISKGTC